MIDAYYGSLIAEGEEGLTKSAEVGTVRASRTLTREPTAAGQWPRCWKREGPFSCLIVTLGRLLVTQIPRQLKSKRSKQSL